MIISQQRILYVESQLYSIVYSTCLPRARCHLDSHRAHGRNPCKCLDAVHPHNQWLVRLVIKIDDRLTISPNDFTLDPQDFLPSLAGARPFVHVLLGNRRRYYETPVDTQIVLNTLRSILYQWLEIPDDKDAEYRSAIVEIFHNSLGPGALLLPSVWLLCSSVPEWVYSDVLEFQKSYRYTDAEPLRLFAKCVDLLPAHEEYMKGTGLIHDLWGKYKTLTTALRTEGKSLLPVKAAPTVPSPADSTSPLGLSTFLQDCLKHRTGNLSPRHPLYTNLRDNPDFYHPFREKAPSRVNFTSQVTKNFLESPRGLFNLLVFRILMFNSPAGREAAFDFTLDSFEEYWATHDLSFFYNPCAYGAISDGRLNPDVYRLYWILSKVLWPALIAKNKGMLSVNGLCILLSLFSKNRL